MHLSKYIIWMFLPSWNITLVIWSYYSCKLPHSMRCDHDLDPDVMVMHTNKDDQTFKQSCSFYKQRCITGTHASHWNWWKSKLNCFTVVDNKLIAYPVYVQWIRPEDHVDNKEHQRRLAVSGRSKQYIPRKLKTDDSFWYQSTLYMSTMYTSCTLGR